MPSPTRAKHFRHFTAKSLGSKHDGQEHGWVGPRMAASAPGDMEALFGRLLCPGIAEGEHQIISSSFS